MFCIKCGATLADGAAFCHSCGADVSAGSVADGPSAPGGKRPAFWLLMVAVVLAVGGAGVVGGLLWVGGDDEDGQSGAALASPAASATQTFSGSASAGGLEGGGSHSRDEVAELAVSICLADFQVDGWRDIGGGVLEGGPEAQHLPNSDYVWQVRDFTATPTEVELTAADRANGIEEEWEVELSFVDRYKGPGIVPAGAWTALSDSGYNLALRRRSGQWERAENFFQGPRRWVSAAQGLPGGCTNYW